MLEKKKMPFIERSLKKEEKKGETSKERIRQEEEGGEAKTKNKSKIVWYHTDLNENQYIVVIYQLLTKEVLLKRKKNTSKWIEKRDEYYARGRSTR